MRLLNVARFPILALGLAVTTPALSSLPGPDDGPRCGPPPPIVQGGARIGAVLGLGKVLWGIRRITRIRAPRSGWPRGRHRPRQPAGNRRCLCQVDRSAAPASPCMNGAAAPFRATLDFQAGCAEGE